MTTSVLTAAIFATMCYILPTADGTPVIQVPTEEVLNNTQVQTGSSSSSESDSSSEHGQASLGSWKVPTSDELDAKTLVLGESQ